MERPEVPCPVCGSAEYQPLYPEYAGRCISTQMRFYENIVLDNRCCSRCGLIFNAQGFRNQEEEFFSYETEERKPQLLSFAKNVMTTQQRAMEVFERMTELPATGSLLDFGAGPGSFLAMFQERYPGWELAGIEPRGDFPALTRNVKLKHAFNQPYFEVETEARFDVIVVMSVLEHVPDPMHGMRWIHKHLKPGGKVLMRHPNFANLPGDLFCPDHLNKMTIIHTRQMAEAAGLEVTAETEQTSLFYFVLARRDQPLRELPDCAEENLAIARKAEAVAKASIDAVGKAAQAARGKGKKAAVFGISPVGSMAHLLLGCKDDIACFVDENQNAWGRKIDGLEVVGPERMAELKVSDLALAISPLYWEQVAAKMKPLGVTVRVPQV